MGKDKLFLTQETSCPFEFNQAVADVFDDMLHRSVPFYTNILSQMAQLANNTICQFPEKNIYDLGCSLGGWVPYLIQHNNAVNYIGMDASPDMIRKARRHEKETIKFIEQDISKLNALPNAGIIACNLVLQFIPVAERARLIQLFFKSLPLGGRFLLVEKIHEENELQGPYTQFYHEYKSANDYSAIEIENKDRALKNILITQTQSHYEQMISDAGFQLKNTFFKWYNFIGIVAEKYEQ